MEGLGHHPRAGLGIHAARMIESQQVASLVCAVQALNTYNAGDLEIGELVFDRLVLELLQGKYKKRPLLLESRVLGDLRDVMACRHARHVRDVLGLDG